MPAVIERPPYSEIKAVTEILHGVKVTDPYRWLEDQDSPRAREWIEAQNQYARAYLDSIPGRESIRSRVREFLAVESYDSVFTRDDRYFFRKRRADEEQPGIYMRQGADGEDKVLVDPSKIGSSKYLAVRPLNVSSDGRFLLYEIKEGGERTGKFAVLDVESRYTLPDILPRGYLRGFSFAPNSDGFYYAHESISERPLYRAVYYH